jgi:NMD protein affecting ribosome stability and mRNA decay
MRAMAQVTCPVCFGLFAPVRTWQRFCSPKCRHVAWKDQDLARRFSEFVCAYCGESADTLDHVPPLCTRTKITEMGLGVQYPSFEVRCCRECNCALGSRAIWTLRQRRKFIGAYLKKRYARYLKIPNWTRDEMGPLGRTLSKYVLRGLAEKERAEARITFTSRHGLS